MASWALLIYNIMIPTIINVIHYVQTNRNNDMNISASENVNIDNDDEIKY